MADEIGYVKGSLPGWGDLSEEAHEKNPDLQWPQSTEKYDQMRREDAQVGSVLRAVTMPIRSARWEIDPGDARDEVVQLIAEDLGLPVKGQEEPYYYAMNGRTGEVCGKLPINKGKLRLYGLGLAAACFVVYCVAAYFLF